MSIADAMPNGAETHNRDSRLDVAERVGIDGSDLLGGRVVIGRVISTDDPTRPFVDFDGSLRGEVVRANTAIMCDEHLNGAEVALMFEGGDPAKPFIIGCIWQRGIGARQELAAQRMVTATVTDGSNLKVEDDSQRFDSKDGRNSSYEPECSPDLAGSEMTHGKSLPTPKDVEAGTRSASLNEDVSAAATSEQSNTIHQTSDGELTISGRKQITLRCGKSSITLTESGKIILRGKYILSRSEGVNRIKGGSVQIN